VTESVGQTNLQAYTNTVAGKSVKAEAMVQVDLNGVPVGVEAGGQEKVSLYTDGGANALPTTTTQPASSARRIAVQFPTGSVNAVNFAAGATVVANIAVASTPFTQETQGTLPPGTDKGLASMVFVTDASGFWQAWDRSILGSQALVLQQDVSGNLKVAQQGTVTVSQNLLGATDKPDVTANQSGTLKVSNANIPLLSTDQANNLQTINLAESGQLSMLISLQTINGIPAWMLMGGVW